MRNIGSARGITVRAACGHETGVYVPPCGGRPGPVGQKNIAEAKARPCYDCRTTPEEKAARAALIEESLNEFHAQQERKRAWWAKRNKQA
jgi:hypothetical protein